MGAVVAVVPVVALVAAQAVALGVAPVVAPADAHPPVLRQGARRDLALEHLALMAADTMAVALPCLIPLVPGHPRDLSRLLSLLAPVLSPSCPVSGSTRSTPTISATQ